MNVEDIKQLNKAKEKYPEFFTWTHILELGSRNINGSVKECFNNFGFVGVDWVDGKDVDFVCKFHETDFKMNKDVKIPFDVLISYSAFEHDPFWKESINHNLPFLRIGGMIFFNWGGPNSTPHGLHYSADIIGEPTGAYKGKADLTDDDPIGGYFPKSMKQMTDLLEDNSVTILETGTQHGPSGEVHWLIGKKM